jgi:YD repeat-containing protein
VFALRRVRPPAIHRQLRRSVVSLLSGDSQSTTTSYGYDSLARLTSATSSGGSSASYAYAYDANGNRTSQSVNGSSSYYLYNAANQLCWSGSSLDSPQ